jgi:N-acylneuraminate cytidylyltransferase
MAIVALVPLRGGSKSIPKKNIKSIAGKPLCAWVLDAASKSFKIDSIFVSTDCSEIADIVESLDLGIEIIFRPENLATDEASTESVMLHFMSVVEFNTLVTIQATSPLLTAKDLDQAIGEFHDCHFDSMLSAVRTKRFFWSDDSKPINYDPLHRPRRQDFVGTFMENGAFYITKKNILKEYKSRLGGKIGIYEMDEKTAHEIDEPADWDYAEQLILGQL